MTIKEMIAQKEAQRSALVERSQKSEDVNELRSINAQLDAVNKDIEQMRAIEAQQNTEEDARAAGKTKAAENAESDTQEARTKAVNGDDEDDAEDRRKKGCGGGHKFMPGKGFDKRDASGLENGNTEMRALEERGQALKEGRSVTIASVGIIVPSHESSTINQPFMQVSSLIDNVGHMDFQGGESFKQPFKIATAAGGYTAEGVAYTEAETTFGLASLDKAKVTAIYDISEEMEKLPAAPYAQNCQAGITESLRAQITREILIGDGATNHLTGIFSTKVATKQTDSPVAVIDAAKDITMAAIDNTTLDTIVFSYGGDEAVEGVTCLILNKLDLLAFSKVRTNSGERFYDIRPSGNGNTGTINGVPYVINSACFAVSSANTTVGQFCMAYGNLQNYQLVTFSPTDIKKSYDAKFSQGLVSVRGSIFVGGNVVRQNGFVRVKRAATA